MANYITVDTFKSENPKLDFSGISDATLEAYITKASARVDEIADTSFDQTTQTDEIVEGILDSGENFVFFPKKTPIQSISSLAIVKGTTTIDITLQDGDGNNNYTIPTSKDRVIIPLWFLAFVGTTIFNVGALKNNDWFFKATYVGGPDAVPASVADATGLIVQDILARSQNTSGATRVSQGGISISYGNRSGKSDFVKDAELLLAHYRRVSGF